MILYLLQGLTLGFSAVVSPGPLQLFLLGETLKHGWRRVLPAALAPLLSDLPIILLTLFVLTRLPAQVLVWIQIVGGLYLLYLGGRLLTADTQVASVGPHAQQSPPAHSSRKSLGQAALMNLLNPNPYIFWGSVLGPLFLQGWQQSPSIGLSFMAGFYIAMVTGLGAFILILALTGHLSVAKMLRLHQVASVGLILFGVYQIGQGWGNLLLS